jgi:hypothetical protein
MADIVTKAQALLVSDARLWLTEGRDEIVSEDDPRAAFLLCGEGDTVTEDDLRNRGVKVTLEDIAKATAPKAPPQPASQAKAQAMPAETKHRAGPETTKRR